MHVVCISAGFQHLKDGSFTKHQSRFGTSGAYVVLRKDGTLCYDLQGHYVGLTEDLKERSAIPKVSALNYDQCVRLTHNYFYGRPLR